MMQAANRSYVRRVNEREGRTGTLWERRFHSTLVDTDQYLLACQRYIELNPVRARMVAHPGDYRWSIYRANAQGRANALLVPHSAFELIALDLDERRRRYAEFIEQGIPCRGSGGDTWRAAVAAEVVGEVGGVRSLSRCERDLTPLCWLTPATSAPSSTRS